MHRKLGARDRNVTLLQRLPHHFEHVALEFSKLIEEEDAIVGEADFARLRKGAAADQCDIRCRMVWCAEWPPRKQRTVCPQFSGNGMDFSAFQGFGQREGRQNCWNALGQHCFSASWWTNQQQIVASCRGNFQGTLGRLLTFDIDEVKIIRELSDLKKLTGIFHKRLDFRLAIQEIHCLS